MATSIIPPGGSTDIDMPKEPPVPEESVHLLGTSEGTIYVYGKLMYVDAFGKERTTKYRLIYGGREKPTEGRMGPDIEGNEAT